MIGINTAVGVASILFSNAITLALTKPVAFLKGEATQIEYQQAQARANEVAAQNRAVASLAAEVNPAGEAVVPDEIPAQAGEAAEGAETAEAAEAAVEVIEAIEDIA